MKTVLLTLVLGTALVGQLPPLPEPAGQPLPPLTKDPGFPGLPGPRQQDEKKPPPLVYVTPGAAVPKTQGNAVPPVVDNGKPPPLKLIAPEQKVQNQAPAPLPSFPVPPEIKLSQGLTVQHYGPANVKAGQPFCYDIVVRNLGTAPTLAARLEEDLPPGTKFVSALPPPVIQGDKLTWNVENITPGSEHRFKLEVEATRDGDWKAQAQLIVVVGSSYTAKVTGVPVQPMLNVSGPRSAPVGHPVAFPIRVTNTGATPLNDAILRVLMSSGLQHLQGEAIEGPLGDLLPGQSKELTLDAICTQTGLQTVEVALLCNSKSVANTQAVVLGTEQTTLTLRQGGPLSSPVGGEFEIKLEVVNRGVTEIVGVTVTDVLPEGLQFVGGDVFAPYDAYDADGAVDVGNLGAGQTRQVAFRVAARGAGPQLNRVSARATDGHEALLHTIIRVVGP